MTYAEILAAVNALTGHGDLPAETEQMIQAATLRMHHSDFYDRDLQEDRLILSTDATVHQFDAPATFTRFRAMRYIRTFVAGVAGEFLTRLDPEAIIDGYGIYKENIWYVAGNNINLRSFVSISEVLCGWYVSPIIAVGTYSSWIATTVPHAIIFDACSLLFQMLNKQEVSRKFDNLVLEQLAMVKMHGLNARGY